MKKKQNPIHINPKHKGELHKELGISEDEKIPEKKLEKAKKDASPEDKKRIVFAENAKKFKHSKKSPSKIKEY